MDSSRANDLIEKIAGKLLTLSDSKSSQSITLLNPGDSVELKNNSTHSSSSNLSLSPVNHTTDHKSQSKDTPNKKESKKQNKLSYPADYSHVKSRIDSHHKFSDKTKKNNSNSNKSAQKDQSIKIPNVDDSLVSFILDEIVDNGQKVKFSDIGNAKEI